MTTQSVVRPLIGRRAVIGGALAGAGLLALPQTSIAGSKSKNSFAVLLKGIYQPASNAPDVGLPGIDLNDGSYYTVPMYPVSGIAGRDDVQTAVGNFYYGNLAVYELPGGALLMDFVAGTNVTSASDGQGGTIAFGTLELTVLDATGNFRHFKGGHNQMLDRLHYLASGDVDEYCVCFVRRHP